MRMRLTRRTSRTLLTLLVVPLAVVACGTDDEAGSDADDESVEV